jgi:dihydroneopterin aldolase/2-amino-4-hydroxy-6-hydroxymethyldihydropteridine diphosphokinase
MKIKPETVYIGVGSNINPQKNIISALALLHEDMEISGVSTFYRTEPVKRKNQDTYLNGVWRIISSESPEHLKYHILKRIEQELGRVRTADKYAPRTIDLDIVLYGIRVINSADITIPDPDIYTRPFIAFPLLELDPNLILPDTAMPLTTITESMSRDTLIPDKLFTERLQRSIQ